MKNRLLIVFLASLPFLSSVQTFGDDDQEHGTIECHFKSESSGGLAIEIVTRINLDTEQLEVIVAGEVEYSDFGSYQAGPNGLLQVYSVRHGHILNIKSNRAEGFLYPEDEASTLLGHCTVF